MKANNDWMAQSGIITHWLEAQLGLPPLLIFLVLMPIFAFLIIFLLREFALALLFVSGKLRQRKKMLRHVSFYPTLLLGILGVGWIWRMRISWFADRLEPIFGTQLENLRVYLIGIVYALLATLILAIVLYLIFRGFRLAAEMLSTWAEQAQEVRVQKIVLIRPVRVRHVATFILRIVRLIIILALVYFYIPLLLSFFPVTAPFATLIMPYVTGPALQFLSAIGGYLPKLFTLVLIVLAVKYLLKLIRFTMSALGKEEIKLPGFDPEWADPTYRLIRAVTILLGLMISYPYLPGAGSEIFKGFSIFVGALVTLGSSAAINNVISGIVLTYTRAFRVGDRVQIGPTLGDIIEKKLFVTRLRNLANEEITVPNGMVLGGAITNLSVAGKKGGLALSITAGIGYDVDWRQVDELMKKAALKTPHIIADPEPFVLETELADFAVSYKLIAYTDKPGLARNTKAQLRRNILDLFNAEGIEIMTPAVNAIRDANHPAIPDKFNPKPFSIPGIRIFSTNH